MGIRKPIFGVSVVLAMVAAVPGSALAAPANTKHALPSLRVAGVTRLCGPVSTYACTTGGYLGSEPWGYYTGAGSFDSSGRRHNCTTYAAFKAASAGMPKPGWSANATGWDTGADLANTVVDQTAVAGAIAQWNSNLGHVAYVETVSADYIEVTDDSFGWNMTNRWRIARSSPAWPDNFIHFTDLDEWFVKTRYTGSGKVEVHNAIASSKYRSARVHAVTRFAPADRSNGWFQMVSGDLYFIKTRNTGTGKVEVHVATRASGYKSGGSWASWFSTGDQNNGWFQMVGTDLYFIKTRNTGTGKVEVHNATRTSGYRSATLHAPTWLGTGDQSNGWFQMVGTDLYFIKTRNTGTGKVEVHNATRASGYRSATLHAPTWLGTGDQSNGWFQISARE